VVRDATPDDARAVARVHVESWQRTYHGLLDPAYLDSLTVEGLTGQWEEVITGGTGDHLLVVEAGGGIQAFAHAGPSHDGDAGAGTAELYKLYAHPDWWSRGVGRAAHDAALERLSDVGYRSARVWVLGTNARARAYYERRGWSPLEGERIQYFGTSVCHDCRYTRPLPAV